MYYVYKTTNIVNNKIYIGVHKSNDIQSDQYFGSGDLLRTAIAKYGKQKFKRQILYQFKDKQSAYAMQKLIVDKQFVKRKGTYNTRYGGEGGFGHMKGTICVKDADGNVFRVDKNDPRYSSGQLIHITKRMVPVRDKGGNTFNVAIDDPRYISGQLSHTSKGKKFQSKRGMVTVKDKYGTNFRVYKDDQRYLSGQLVSVNRGHKYPQNHQAGQRNSQYGTMWITNTIQNKKIKKQQPVPQGWKKGRT